MYRQFSRLQDLKAAQNLAVFIAVKRKSFKCLSTSRLNRDETLNKTFALNFLHRTFALPADYFVRKASGMQPCKFLGKIHVVKNEGDEQRLVQEGVVCKDFERQDALGMDLEYFNESPLQRICLIQLASKENAVLWTCNEGHFRDKLPPYLLSIITGNVLKVGHDLAQDVVLFQKNYGECTNNFVDTLTWAKEMNCDPLNLRAMCAIFLHERLSKLLQQSDWSKDLTEKQILYAATDAWASLRVYEEMKRTAEVIGMALSPPLKSTLDVFQLRQTVKTERNRRKRRRGSERKRELTRLRMKQENSDTSEI